MSFLTPLYLLGALAIALPVLAHLIRRTPPRKREFSSVMFLAPSLPKVTRRSRIENWPLLCLRALVIGLLAFAFARPLWRTPLSAEEPGNARWVAVLIDTSASMRRDGLWDEARRQFDDILSEYGPADHVGVFTYDSAPQLVWSWDAWNAQEPSQRPSAVAAVFEGLEPTWRHTDLAQGLIAAAESLENEAGRQSRTSPKEIVVISDLQAGSELADLQGYVWPEEIPVRLVRVGSAAMSENAGLHPAPASAGAVRVQVTNTEGAAVEMFQVHSSLPVATQQLAEPVASADGTPNVVQQIDVVARAGQSRVIRVPLVQGEAAVATLTLHGDGQPFDNSCFALVPQPQRFSIVYLGDDVVSDPASERFYVGPLFADTRERNVELIDWDRSSAQFPAATTPVRLLLQTVPPTPDQMPAVQEFLRRGGLAIVVLRTPEAAAGLAQLLGVAQIPASEADTDGFSLLTDIDFEHPALAPFADPKYSDFTTLHFWKHRRIDVDALPQLRTLARFDDGALALGEIPVGDGRIVLLTSGWNRDDSQLAVWSKFVPLMNGLLESSGQLACSTAQLTVGDFVPWQSLRQVPMPNLILSRPDGTTTTLADVDEVVRAEAPGFYTLTDGGTTPLATFAVNLAASESDTTPLPSEQLEALGIPLEAPHTQTPPAVSPASRLDVANAEIEQTQRLWRWVLLAAVALLAVETMYAGWLTRREAAV